MGLGFHPGPQPGLQRAVARLERARARCEEFAALFGEPTDGLPPLGSGESRVAAADLAAQYAVPGPAGLTSNFSREQYLAAAEAYLRGIERRIEAGLNPVVGSVASVFISRWDVSVAEKVPESLREQLGIAVARRTYKAYRELLASPRWQRALNFGARPQRLLWASTGTKDPKASDVLYIRALAAPFTVNTVPDGTLKAFADHGEIGAAMPPDGGDCEAILTQFAKAGIDVDALAAQLQDEGAKSFVKSWDELLGVIKSKSTALKTAT